MQRLAPVVIDIVMHGLGLKSVAARGGKLELHRAHSEKLIVHLAEAYEYDVYILVGFKRIIFVVKAAGYEFGYGILRHELPRDKLVLAETTYERAHLVVRIRDEALLYYFYAVLIGFHIQRHPLPAPFDGYKFFDYACIRYIAAAEKYKIIFLAAQFFAEIFKRATGDGVAALDKLGIASAGNRRHKQQTVFIVFCKPERICAVAYDYVAPSAQGAP